MKENKNEVINIIKSFIKWVIIGSLVGICAGVVGSVFHLTLELVTNTRLANPRIILALPLVGLLIVFLYKKAGMLNDGGTNLVLTAIRNESERPKLISSILIFISTALTHLFGGSAGREGAALQLGAGISVAIGEKLKLSDKDLTIISMCGMSAGFSALFGTPFVATVFSMEVISVGIMHYSAFVPCITSAFVARIIAMHFGIEKTFFNVSFFPEMNTINFFRVLILGAGIAFVSFLFCTSIHTATSIYKKYLKNPFVRVFVGGLIVALFSLITVKYCGAGMDSIIDAIENGNANYYDFILKIILTAITIGAGFKGGEIVPTFFTGSTFGAAFAPLIGLPAGFGGALGLVGVFCASVNCPLSAIALGVELFGAEGLIYFAIASAVSYMLSGYYGLYREQKIVYSKYKAEFINRKVI